ncbi:MAG: hypothetical protein ACN4GF_00155 [Lentimonas sp.]
MDREQVKIDLQCIAQKQALRSGETMADVLRRLDSVAGERDLPARLQHYLSQRSYIKALEWLENPEIPHYT